MSNLKKFIFTSCITLANIAWLGEASAVGDGLNFNFDETPIAGANIVSADSLDLTYHACTKVNDRDLFERGYYWHSSFQDIDSVVDSQINHILQNGYHIYAKYNFNAEQRGSAQYTITGNRLNYEVLGGAIEIWVDRLSDTQLQLTANCEININNIGDDRLLGSSNVVAQGEKSEADGLAQGDFKIVFDNWLWGQAGNTLMTANQPGLILEDFNYLVFNGNVTNLNGLLGDNHNPEGSGNVFWLLSFDPLPVGMD